MTPRHSILLLSLTAAAFQPAMAADVEIYQTTRQGDRLQKIEAVSLKEDAQPIAIDPSTSYQKLIGIGGAFTESAAQAISELSKGKRESVLQAYFSAEGAHYSLTRTHIGSCDFSVTNYSYAPVPGDAKLEHFSIDPDRKYLLPMIKDSLAIPGADFKIMASPWTAPPWMKTNNDWNGGSLRREHYPTFADYIVRYIQEYRKEGVPIWGITPENEPLGNGSNWESMHFTAAEMRDLIGGHLGPALRKDDPKTTLWAYDQNRDAHLVEWADTILADKKAANYVSGFAVHWYQSTRDIGAEVIDKVSWKYPDKPIIHTEGCIDAVGDDEPIGAWLKSDWYWREEASDWGFLWAAPDGKKNHPKYRPFYRYVRDLIEGFNAGFVGWIDWNLALNTRGGPNHARNFCLAPILIDSGNDAVLITPLYYAIAHFSKFIRPGAVRIGLEMNSDALSATAFRNEDGSMVAVIFNASETDRSFSLSVAGSQRGGAVIPAQALQTVVIANRNR